MTTETNNTRPTHRIFAVTKGDKKTFWQPIGALWAHSDGKGFNQRLDTPPISYRHHPVSRLALAAATNVLFD